jgi:O-antigen ligase
LLLAAWAGIMLLQLVPLPPDLWLSFPGHMPFAEAAAAGGFPQPWRPISLTPDLTLNSLMALLPALAMLIGFAALDEDQRGVLLVAVLVLAFVSALVGIIQLTSRLDSPAFLYRVTHKGSAVGLFANRNHQAGLLALCFPLLRVWSLLPAVDARRQQLRLGLASALGLFLIAMILVTGSRAGLVLGAVGLAVAYIIAPWRPHLQVARRHWLISRYVYWAIPLALVVLVVFLGRAVSVQRLALLQDPGSESRIANIPVMFEIVREFFPIGSGFGSFDLVFRAYEPDWALSPSYFNHAHNELLEVAITGGLPALLLVLLFLIWWCRAALVAFRPAHGLRPTVLLARAGAGVTLIPLVASLVEYPLRTPLFSAVFAIGCAWLSQALRARAP